MTKKKQLFILLLLISKISFAQNLVANSDFEYYTNCPQLTTGYGDLNYATPWFHAGGSPDYFNICDPSPVNLGVPSNTFGNQLAHSGVGYGGFYALFYMPSHPSAGREYMEVPLSHTLNNGTSYVVSFYVSLADHSSYAVNNIGCYFSPGAVNNPAIYGDYLQYTPQIVNISSNPLTNDTGWTFVSGTFTATGIENYLTIGNFNPDSLSDTTFVGFHTNNDFSYYYVDDVSVIENTNVDIKNNYFADIKHVFPNPFYDKLTFKIESTEEITVYLLDSYSRKILHQPFRGSTVINTEQLENGIYFYELRNDKQIITMGKLIKN